MNDYPVLREPSDGIPDVVDTPAAWQACVQAIGAGTGPIAVDAERAQGFRYDDKAYLIQLRRAKAGTFLVDPIALEPGDGYADLSALHDGGAEWIIHAATQDLPNLNEVGIAPERVFDTELAARLLGWDHVGLAAVAERICGVSLAKEHSAADWSTRPLPRDWLVYAALDVELLIEMRESLAALLRDAGKDEWARQEFAWEVTWARRPKETRPDSWRHTSGMGAVKNRRGMAVVRELWYARDEIARRENLGPGKILPDRAIAELGSKATKTTTPQAQALRSIDGFKRRRARRYEHTWLDALARVAGYAASELPAMRGPRADVPPLRSWERISPPAAQRWHLVRPPIVELSKELNLPVENLISPAPLRELCWNPPEEVTIDSVDAQLAAHDARPWQRELITPLIVSAMASG